MSIPARPTGQDPQSYWLWYVVKQLEDLKKITLEEIWSGAFRTKGMDALNAMKNTNQYTVLNFDRSTRSYQIDLYDFATLEKVSTLFDTKNHTEIKEIDSYLIKMRKRF